MLFGHSEVNSCPRASWKMQKKIAGFSKSTFLAGLSWGEGTNDLEYFEPPKNGHQRGSRPKPWKKVENHEKTVIFLNFSLVLVIQRLRPRLEGLFFAKKSLSKDLLKCVFLGDLGMGDGRNRPWVLDPFLWHLFLDRPISQNLQGLLGKGRRDWKGSLVGVGA